MGVQSQLKSSGTTMKSSANLKGQLGTRSGPLSPESSKLTTQYLVLDHMTNHYSKITKAKSAIDNRPPKSISTSQKARDRKVRDHVTKTGTRPASSASTRRQRPHTGLGYYDADIYNEQLWGDVDPDDEEDKLAYEIMRTTLTGQQQTDGYHGHQGYPDPVHIPAARGNRPQRPSSARSHRSMGSVTSARQLHAQVVPQKGTYSGDVLNKRAHAFTEEKPFTPRTLKTDRVSRLSQYKYYNKPPPKDAKKDGKGAPGSSAPPAQPKDKPAPSASVSRPQPKPRPRKTSANMDADDTLNSLTFETLQTRDLRHIQDRDQVVPPLDISLDTDQMKYIKNQGMKSNGHTPHANDTLRSTSGTLKADGTYGSSIDFGKTGEMSLTYGTMPDSKTRTYGTKNLISSQRLSEEEEEAKYVDFVKAVTNDVLNRGIYTDNALSRVFEAHIKQRRGQLDEFRMRNMINQIRADLGISRSDSNDLHIHLNDIDNTMESSIKDHDTRFLGSLPGPSKESSTYESPDSLQFRSTDEIYSTIRSEVPNGALSDTQALRDYQMTISKKDDISEESEGEIVDKNYRSDLLTTENRNYNGLEVTQNAPPSNKTPPASVITVQAEVHSSGVSSGQASPAPPPRTRQGNEKSTEEGSIVSRPGSSRVESTRNTDVSEEEEYGDDEYEDDYD